MCVIDMDVVPSERSCGSLLLYVVMPVVLLSFFGLMLLRVW